LTIAVVPLAGKDPRFEALNTHKSMVPIEGKPLVKFCTDSLRYPFSKDDLRLFFIVLREHDLRYLLSEKLKRLYPHSEVAILEAPTEGAACTVLSLKETINCPDELVVYLADIFFRGDLEGSITAYTSVDGFIPCFKSHNPKYSYAIADADGNVSQVAEKRVISENASAGLYYFRKGSYFVEAAERMIRLQKRVNNAFYICPVYNEMLAAGHKVKVIPSEFGFDLGDDRFIRRYVGSDLYDKGDSL
jgi:NDP-sugar pyrophosphorylase family protein